MLIITSYKGAPCQCLLLITSPNPTRKHVETIRVVLDQCLWFLSKAIFTARQDGRGWSHAPAGISRIWKGLGNQPQEYFGHKIKFDRFVWKKIHAPRCGKALWTCDTRLYQTPWTSTPGKCWCFLQIETLWKTPAVAQVTLMGMMEMELVAVIVAVGNNGGDRETREIYHSLSCH